MKTELGYKILKNINIPIIKNLWIGNIDGIENVPKEGPCIVIVNHCSYIDFLIIGTLFEGILNIPISFWANLKVVNHPIFKYYAKYFKCIAVDVENPTMKFWKDSVIKIENGNFLCIFPEGTRSRNGKLHESSTGYLRLANTTKTQIIPIHLSNTFQILPPHKKYPNFQKSDIKIFKSIKVEKKMNKQEMIDLNSEIYNLFN